MFLRNQDLVELVAWRRMIHARPEISGEEAATAAAVVDLLAPTEPDEIVTGLGGTGVAVVYAGAEPGPTVMIRAELDALPIEELSDLPHRSTVPGKAHLCGHDGHMAMVAALGRGLGRERPRRGRVVLLFQPAEETGMGAAAVIADPRFAALAPDYAFALHNLPGLPRGEVAIRDGLVNCASRGLRIALSGKTAHASMPETGVSPMGAVARLMPALTGLGEGDLSSARFAMVTVTHASMGEPAFGIAPGAAEIWATLRTLSDGRMAELCAAAEALAHEAAAAAGLGVGLDWHDVFHHSDNHPEAVALLRAAMDREGVPHADRNLPMRASEDFGRFGATARSAMFFLGAGVDHAALHNPDYDFPDEILPVGARVFMRVIRDIVG